MQTLFPQAIKLHLRQHPSEEFEVRDVERLLQDVIDTIRDEGSPPPEIDRRAHVAMILDYEDNYGEPTAYPAREKSAKRQKNQIKQEPQPGLQVPGVQEPTPQPQKMERVDLDEDPRIFCGARRRV